MLQHQLPDFDLHRLLFALTLQFKISQAILFLLLGLLLLKFLPDLFSLGDLILALSPTIILALLTHRLFCFFLTDQPRLEQLVSQ
jgi:hypothetical protein